MIKNITKKYLLLFFIITSSSSFLFIIRYALASNSYDYKSNYSFSKNCIRENKLYTVMKVFDGDTILIRTKEQHWDNKKGEYEKSNGEYTKVRLLGIDAFEHDQPPFGNTAKDFLTMLVLNKNICIETDVQEKDIYGRTLGYVFINEPTNLRTKEPTKSDSLTHRFISSPAYRLMSSSVQLFVNKELLKNGEAILYNFPPNIKYIDKLKKAQIYARGNMLGIWEKHDYILETPSQWRHKHHKVFSGAKKL